MASHLDLQVEAEVVRRLAAGAPVAAVARELRLTAAAVRRINFDPWQEALEIAGLEGAAIPLNPSPDRPTPPGPSVRPPGAPAPERPDHGPTTIEREVHARTASAAVAGSRLPLNERDVMALCGVDADVWRVKKWHVAPATHRDGAVHWRARADFERVLEPSLHEAIERLCARMVTGPVEYPDIEGRVPGGDHLCVLDLPDVHFGKLAWAPETGQNYDLEIAQATFDHAVDDLLAEVTAAKSIGRIVFPIGQDYLQIDNLAATTTAGTSVDTDGRYPKIFEAALDSAVRAVEKMAAVAPTDVVLVPGNHDRQSAFALACVLKARFRGVDHVDVDTGPALRKYVRWGATLIGFTHPDGLKQADLANLLLVENSDRLKGTTCWEWHLGHYHTKRQYETQTIDETKGVVSRYLWALTAADEWHVKHGFVGNRQAAEAYLYHPEHGYKMHVPVYARAS